MLCYIEKLCLLSHKRQRQKLENGLNFENISLREVEDLRFKVNNVIYESAGEEKDKGRLEKGSERI